MHAALIKAWGDTPVWTVVPDLPAPTANQLHLRVLAAGLHRVVHSIANGADAPYSILPHTPGVDGVGLDEATGTKYYFSTLGAGSFAEYVNVDKNATFPLAPDANHILVAGMMNPAACSWMALKKRVNIGTQELPPDWSLLILGATTMSGQIASSIARHLGAKRIIGAARNSNALDRIPELDERMPMRDEPSDGCFDQIGHVDVVLDYVSGPYPEAVIKALQPQREIVYLHVSIMSGDEEFRVPTRFLRAKRVTIRGCGPGSWDPSELADETMNMLEMFGSLKTDGFAITAKFSDIEDIWDDTSESQRRLVLVP